MAGAAAAGSSWTRSSRRFATARASCRRFAGSTSSSQPARPSRCSGRTAPASRRRSTCSSACSTPTAARVEVFGSRAARGDRPRRDRRDAPDGRADPRPLGARARDDDGLALPDAARCRRGARADRDRRHRRPPDAEALGRADPARPVRGRARQQPRPARPRRADRGDGRRGPPRLLDDDARVRLAGQDRPLRDALPRGGRRLRRPRRADGATATIVADGPPNEIKAMVGTRTIRATPAGAPLEALERLPGVTHVERRGEAVVLQLHRLRRRRSGRLLAAFPEARDIEITGAGLEAAFMQLTGGDDEDERRCMAPTSSTSSCGRSGTGGSSSSRSASRSILYFLIAGPNKHTANFSTDGPLRAALLHGRPRRVRDDERDALGRRADRGRARPSAGTGSCGSRRSRPGRTSAPR